MSAPLTKKQQKALAFRAKQKAKKADIEAPPDLPEQDEEEPEQLDAVVASSSSTKDEASTSTSTANVTEGGASAEGGKSKEKKRKTAWDDDDKDKGGKDAKKTRKDGKQRFILFVGNLGFKTTKEQVQKHFEEAVGSLPSVRLLTTKPLPGQTPKSRGIAFLELTTSEAMQSALKLHHSNLSGRTINVELTAGGGGAGEERKRKIKERNERVGTQREKKAEREKEEADAAGETGGGGGGQDGGYRERNEGGDEVGGDGKVRIRGGRRVKPKQPQSQSQDAPAAKRPRPNGDAGWSRPSNGACSSNYRGAGGDSRPDGGKFQRKKWQPTGANALSVG